MRDWIVPLLLALAVVGAFGLLMTFSLKPPPTVLDEASSGDAPLREPSVDAASGREPVTPGSSLPGTAGPHLDDLRRQCVEDTRTGKALDRHPDSACQKFAVASRAQLPAPKKPLSLPPASTPPPRSGQTPQAASRYVPVYVEQCTHQAQGSIAYRKCRSREAERLRSLCRQYRYQADNARSGDEAVRNRGYARSYCREADRYRVLD